MPRGSNSFDQMDGFMSDLSVKEMDGSDIQATDIDCKELDDSMVVEKSVAGRIVQDRNIILGAPIAAGVGAYALGKGHRKKKYAAQEQRDDAFIRQMRQRIAGSKQLVGAMKGYEEGNVEKSVSGAGLGVAGGLAAGATGIGYYAGRKRADRDYKIGRMYKRKKIMDEINSIGKAKELDDSMIVEKSVGSKIRGAAREVWNDKWPFPLVLGTSAAHGGVGYKIGHKYGKEEASNPPRQHLNRRQQPPPAEGGRSEKLRVNRRKKPMAAKELDDSMIVEKGPGKYLYERLKERFSGVPKEVDDRMSVGKSIAPNLASRRERRKVVKKAAFTRAAGKAVKSMAQRRKEAQLARQIAEQRAGASASAKYTKLRQQGMYKDKGITGEDINRCFENE